MIKEQTFSRSEIKEIIKQASILQNQNSQMLNSDLDGLTKEEIIEICEEVGIDPSNANYAIHEILRKNFSKKSGYTNTTVYDFIIVRTTISEEECWEIVSHELSYHIPNSANFKIYTSKETGKWSYKDILNKQIYARIEKFKGGYSIKLTDQVSDSDPRTKSVNISSIISVAITGFIFLNSSMAKSAAILILIVLFGLSYLFSYQFEMDRRKTRLAKLTEIGTILGESIPES